MYIVHATLCSHYKHFAPRKVRRKAMLKTTTHYNVYTNTSHLYIVTSTTMHSTCHTLSQTCVFVLQMSGRLWGVWLCVALTRGDHCHRARYQQECWLILYHLTMLVMLVISSSLQKRQTASQMSLFQHKITNKECFSHGTYEWCWHLPVTWKISHRNMAPVSSYNDGNGCSHGNICKCRSKPIPF